MRFRNLGLCMVFQRHSFFLPKVGLVFSSSFALTVLSDSCSHGRGTAVILCVSSGEAKSGFSHNHCISSKTFGVQKRDIYWLVMLVAPKKIEMGIRNGNLLRN